MKKLAKAIKSAVKTALVALKKVRVSRAYTAFKRLDKAAYVAQGELTVCAIRGCEIVDFTGQALAKGAVSFLLRTTALGVALMSGVMVTVEGAQVLRAGNFGLVVEKNDKLFTSYAALVAYVKKNGKATSGERKDGQRFTHVYGEVGAAYAFAITAKGGMIRLENNSSSACAAKFDYTVS